MTSERPDLDRLLLEAADADGSEGTSTNTLQLAALNADPDWDGGDRQTAVMEWTVAAMERGLLRWDKEAALPLHLTDEGRQILADMCDAERAKARARHERRRGRGS